MLDIVIKNYTLFCLVLKEKIKGTLHSYFYLQFDKKNSDFNQQIYDGLIKRIVIIILLLLFLIDLLLLLLTYRDSMYLTSSLWIPKDHWEDEN